MKVLSSGYQSAMILKIGRKRYYYSMYGWT